MKRAGARLSLILMELPPTSVAASSPLPPVHDASVSRAAVGQTLRLCSSSLFTNRDYTLAQAGLLPPPLLPLPPTTAPLAAACTVALKPQHQGISQGITKVDSKGGNSTKPTYFTRDKYNWRRQTRQAKRRKEEQKKGSQGRDPFVLRVRRVHSGRSNFNL